MLFTEKKRSGGVDLFMGARPDKCINNIIRWKWGRKVVGTAHKGVCYVVAL